METSLQNKAELPMNERSSLALTLLFLHAKVYHGSGAILVACCALSEGILGLAKRLLKL